MHGQHKYADGRIGADDPRDEVHAVGVAEGQIQQDQVGMQADDDCPGGRLVGGLPADGQIAPGQCFPNGMADEG